MKLKSETKSSFNNSKRAISKEGMHSCWQKNHDSKEMFSFIDHVYGTQGKLLDKWMTERYKASYADGSWGRLQERYAKQLANNLGLPMTNETIDYMKEMFINGDD